MNGSIYKRVLMLVFLMFVWLLVAAQAEVNIKVNIPGCTLTAFEDGRKVAAYSVRVGTPESPTPAGKGKIVEKRERVVLRYLEGEQKGEIIKYPYRSHRRDH